MKTQVFSVLCLAALTATSVEASFGADYAPKLIPIYELIDKYLFLVVEPMMKYGFYN